jgi:hypothetical protein
MVLKGTYIPVLAFDLPDLTHFKQPHANTMEGAVDVAVFII